MATGRTTVPTRSMNCDVSIIRRQPRRTTTNCIEKQKVPQRLGTRTSSNRLWMVELIHRRRCESRTLNVSGTTVRQTADRGFDPAGEMRLGRRLATNLNVACRKELREEDLGSYRPQGLADLVVLLVRLC